MKRILQNKILNSSENEATPQINIVGDNPLTIDQGEDYIEQGATTLNDQGNSIQVPETGIVNTLIPASYPITYTLFSAKYGLITAIRIVIVKLKVGL